MPPGVTGGIFLRPSATAGLRARVVVGARANVARAGRIGSQPFAVGRPGGRALLHVAGLRRHATCRAGTDIPFAGGTRRRLRLSHCSPSRQRQAAGGRKNDLLHVEMSPWVIEALSTARAAPRSYSAAIAACLFVSNGCMELRGRSVWVSKHRPGHV